MDQAAPQAAPQALPPAVECACTATPTGAADVDILDFEELSTAEVQLKHPVTGADLNQYITIAGPEDPERKRLDFERQRKVTSRVLQTGGKWGGSETVEEAEAEQIDVLAAAVRGWRGGKFDAIQCTPANVREALRKSAVLRRQLSAALNDRARFIRGSVTA